MTTNRKLVAILAADVVGYSRLMEADEAATMTALKERQKNVLEPLVSKHHGRIVKLMGDGVLIEFSSAVEAVQCAVDLQRAMQESNEGLPEDRAVLFRIGINLGDVVIEESGDILGDGVNVAARLEGIAEPGGICVSAPVRNEVHGRISMDFEDAGEVTLKNLTRPVHVFRMIHTGTNTPPDPARREASEKPSIAILPFVNMSGDPEQEYFSDGITEDIITELARFRELLVIARNSSFSFRGKAVDIRTIGRMLSANYLVEGSVRRAGNQVRITAQLVDAESGAHLWADRYDRPMEDVFAVQDEIARGIVATVAARVLEQGERIARRKPPENVRAYDLFLQGLRLSDDFSPESRARARDLYERARTLDPSFARAYTGLAFWHLSSAIDLIGIPLEEDTHRAEALRLAEQALALDPNDARVQYTMGYMSLVWRDFDRAERHIDLARSMNPNDAGVQIVWGWVKACVGKAEQAIPAAELALRLNPRHPRYYEHYFSRILFLAGRIEEARTMLARITADPKHFRYHPRDLGWLAAAEAELDNLEQARFYADRFLEVMRQAWKGDPSASSKEYVEWLVERSFLRLSRDETRLREGLRRAGLPA